MKQARKEIQQQRMWQYFLDAATDIIDEEGIDQLTVRKIADRAGYTSSTVYNYFKDLFHLKFFATMRYTKDYVNELPNYISRGNNTIEKWLYSWVCFCKHSFERPEIYSILFMENLGSIPEEVLVEYYNIYRDDLTGVPEEIKSIIMEQSFSKRSTMYIQGAIEEGFIKEENVEYISDVTLMIWKGMMSTYMNHRRKMTTDEVITQTLTLVYESVIRVINVEKRKDVDFHPVHACEGIQTKKVIENE